MNAIERKIASTFAPALLDEIEEREIKPLQGKIAPKNYDRILLALAYRRVLLASGIEEAFPVEPVRVASRNQRWVSIEKTDSKGCVWLEGWERKKSSRKAGQTRMLKEPLLLYDPSKKAERQEKKRAPKKKSQPKKELDTTPVSIAAIPKRTRV